LPNFVAITTVVATARDRAADEPLVRERPVHVGRVQQRHAEVERAVDRRDRLASSVVP
jgi:hypothetical protein